MINQEENALENRKVKNHKDKNSMPKDSDIGMVKCQAYGEAGVKYMAGGNKEENAAGGVYEHVGVGR